VVVTTYSKRDYAAFAHLIKISANTYYNAGKYAELEGVHEVIGRLADLFAMDNPKFDRNKFWKAAAEDENWRNKV